MGILGELWYVQCLDSWCRAVQGVLEADAGINSGYHLPSHSSNVLVRDPNGQWRRHRLGDDHRNLAQLRKSA